MCKTAAVAFALLHVILVRTAAGDTEKAPAVPVIKEVTGFRMMTPRRQGFGRVKPQIFETAEELASAVDEKAAEKIIAEVSFAEQFLVLFQWAGSGRDKLSFRVDETEEGAKVVFKYRPGLTRDLRPHSHLYAIRKGVAWEIGPKGGPPRFPRRKPTPRSGADAEMTVTDGGGFVGPKMQFMLWPDGTWRYRKGIGTSAVETTGKLTSEQREAFRQGLEDDGLHRTESDDLHPNVPSLTIRLRAEGKWTTVRVRQDRELATAVRKRLAALAREAVARPPAKKPPSNRPHPKKPPPKSTPPGNPQPKELAAAELRAAPTAMVVETKAIQVQASVIRNVMPTIGRGPGGPRSYVVVMLSTKDKTALPENLTCDTVFGIHGEEIWSTVTIETQQGGAPHMIRFVARKAPSWPAKAEVDVVVKLRDRHNAEHLIRAAGVRVMEVH